MAEIEEEIKTQRIVEILKKGIVLTKYATGGMNPHEKTVFINSDGEKLCWVDKGDPLKADAKHIFLSNITDIRHGEIGPAIEKQMDKDRIRKNCFICIHLNSKDRKLVEFGAKTPELMRGFYSHLMFYWNKKYGKVEEEIN